MAYYVDLLWNPEDAAHLSRKDRAPDRHRASAACHRTDAGGGAVQFETIHPFIDGNGRTGRALIHTVLRRTDALRNTLIPISTVFAGDTDSYLAGLTAFREESPRLDDWIIGFVQAAELAAANAVRLSDDIATLDQTVRDDLIRYRGQQGISPANPRSDAVVLRILETLATDPVLTIETAGAGHSVSTAAAHRALVELAEAGILGINKNQKGKLICWTADRHLSLVGLTERSNRVVSEVAASDPSGAGGALVTPRP